MTFQKFVYCYCLVKISLISLNGQISGPTKLPIIKITSTKPISDDLKVAANIQIIDNGLGKDNLITDIPSYQGTIGIEWRGSTSQWFPKKPFSIEVWDNVGNEVDTSLLGMPKESDWVLNAAYNDKTLMRDMLTCIWGGSIMEYAPRGRYCELIVNGSYEGIYIMIEKIKRNKNRVNIKKLDPTIVSGDELTGGYIVKLDKETGGGSVNWQSSYYSSSNSTVKPIFQVDYPKISNINEAQRNYIKSFVDSLENAMFASTYTDPDIGWRKYMDQEALINFIIMNELAKNGDGYRLSTYFYKERNSDGGKIKLGPIWDFNLAFGNIDYCTGGGTSGLVITDFNKICPDDFWIIHFWWQKLLQDKKFYDALKKRWNELRKSKFTNQNMMSTIDSLNTLLKPATARNFNRWPVLGQYVWPNSFVGKTYIEEIDFIKNWTTERLKYLDIVWDYESTNVEEELINSITVSPNPSHDIFVIKMDPKKVILERNPIITDNLGRRVTIATITVLNVKEWAVDFKNLPPNTYYLRINTIGGKEIVIPLVKI
jgi:CotH kinase protein